METLTLQQIIMELANQQRDLSTGTVTTAVSGTVFKDAERISTRDKHWVGSEVFFLEPAYTTATLNGTQPFVVDAFDASDGSFTLNHTAGATIPATLEYAMVRHFGRGNKLDAYKRAIGRAMRRLGVATKVSDDSLTTAASTYSYTIPAGFDTIYAVEVTKGTLGPYVLQPELQWRMRPGRQLAIPQGVMSMDAGYTLTLYGRTFTADLADLDDTLVANLDDLVEYASEFLNLSSPRQGEQLRGSLQQQERLRYRFPIPLPNEMEVLP